MSDLADLLKELEQVAKDTNLKEVKKKPLEESVTSKDDVSSLFEGLEAAYTESKIEEEIKNRLSEEDEQKLNAFSGFMQSVTELTNKPDSNKSIEDLFATIAPPQPQTEIIPDDPIVEETIEEIVEEPTEIEQADTIIEQIVSSLDDMNDKTDVQEQVEQISKLRDEFNNFRSLVQQQMSSTGSGEVRLEFLDDVQRSTAKVDGKFLKFDSSSGKFVGDDPSVTSLAITALDIDGGTDIGADLADADLIIVDDGAGGTNRKSTLARLKTYIGSGSSAADDITAGDAAVNITTSSGNITIDAAANNSDIILKGTDGGSDTTFLTIDGSAAGKATFNDEIVSGAVITSGAGLVIADNGNIGSASDTDAIAIASDGVVTMNQIPVFSAGVNVSGGTIAGTLSTAAQGNITSLGTLTALTVDNVAINGATIGHTDDTDLMTVADGILTVAGEVQMTTLDIGGTNVTSTAAELNLLDGSSANSVVNSKAVIYGSSGELAGTLSTAAQGNVTSLGTLTTLTVDNIIINGTNIGHTSDTDSIAIASDGVVTFSQAPVFPDGSINLADLDIDGGTDIGANLADADLFIVDDGAGGTNRKTAASRIKTYIADVTLTTAAQTNITSLGTLTALTVDSVVVNGSTIGHTDDTDLMTVADGVLTVAGEVDAVSLDVSGDADIDGTLEADAITVNGTALASSATTDTTNASNIGSGTLATARMAAAQTAITSILATDLKIGEDDQTKIDFETADEIHFYAANAEQVFVSDGVFGPQTDSDVDLGTNSTRFKDAYIDTVTTTGLITSGSNLVIADAGNIGSASDTDAMAIASNGVVTFSAVPSFPNDTIETADIQDNAVTLAKMAGLARGKIIVGDSSGDPSALALGSNGQVLQSDGSDLVFGSVSASVALDDIGTGDAASTLATSAGDITIDAQGSNTDIILKGTDGTSDITGIKIDFSENAQVQLNSIAGVSDTNTSIDFEGSDVITFNTGGSEDMRISPDRILFGTTAFSTSTGLSLIPSSGALFHTAPSGGARTMVAYYNGGSNVGEIRTSTTATQYITSSDYRLKENVTNITDGIVRLKQLKPYRFNFIADGDTTLDGFLAHETQTVVPEAVSGTKDEKESDGVTVKPQGIDQSKLVPLLTAALQESVTEIESLKTEIESLKTRVTTLEG